MNKNRFLKRIISLFFILTISLNVVFAQEAVNRAMDLLNRNLILNEYKKAYSYAQFIIKYYIDDGLPEEELAAVQKAVKGYAGDLEKSEDWDALIELEDGLQTAPAQVRVVAQKSFQHAHDYFAAVEAEKEREKMEKLRQEEEQQRMIDELKRAEREKQIKEEKEADTQKIMQLIEKQYNNDLEKEKLRQQSDDKYREQLTEIMSEMNKNNTETIKTVSSNNKSVMIGFVIFVVVFLSVIIFLVLVSYKQNKHNQEQMKNTILTMQAMRSAQPIIDVLPLPLQMENKTLELAGNVSTKPSMLLEDNSSAADAQVVSTEAPQPEILKNLLLACKQYGEQIDKATGRKNVTSQVAELVYKISKVLGYSENEAMLYYAAALVYDIGFLNISPSILQAETLSNEQFMLLKTHTTIGQNMVFFVDEKNRDLFKDATSKHHENLDGTGYPEGLKGDQIPYIARVIHVAESYIALISQRQYKEIHDRNFAIEELRNSPRQYDTQIVEVLDQIV